MVSQRHVLTENDNFADRLLTGKRSRRSHVHISRGSAGFLEFLTLWIAQTNGSSYSGQPRANPSSALQVPALYGGGGLSVLSDTQLIETLAHFSRERIPERFCTSIIDNQVVAKCLQNGSCQSGWSLGRV